MTNETLITKEQFEKKMKELALRLGISESDKSKMDALRENLEQTMLTKGQKVLWDESLDFSSSSTSKPR